MARAGYSIPKPRSFSRSGSMPRSHDSWRSHEVASDEGKLRAVVGEIAAISMADGVGFDATEISLEWIREDADYEGVRLAPDRSGTDDATR